MTAPIDLSSSANAGIQWANDFIDDVLTDSLGEVEVTIDGGATWTSVWRTTDMSAGPGTQTADMSFAAGHSGVRRAFTTTRSTATGGRSTTWPSGRLPARSSPAASWSATSATPTRVSA